MLKGGCFCGAIRHETADTPFHRTFCHCSICRRTIGAPVVAWVPDLDGCEIEVMGRAPA